METSKTIQPNLVEFPEETTQEGVRLYGTASMDNCLAVLTHTLHGLSDKKQLPPNQMEDFRILVNDWLALKGTMPPT